MGREGEGIELAKLVEQLDELLGGPLVDPDDALELAIVAGLASRLGAPAEVMAPALAWRDGPGRELLAETWEQVDLSELLEALDDAIGHMEGAASAGPDKDEGEDEGGDEDEDEGDDPLENALYDLDDIVAAAIWCGKTSAVKAATREMARLVRQVPDPFVPLAPFAVEIARLPTVAQHLDLYDYWLAIADAPAAVGDTP